MDPAPSDLSTDLDVSPAETLSPSNFQQFGAMSLQTPVEPTQVAQGSLYNGTNASLSNQENLSANTYRAPALGDSFPFPVSAGAPPFTPSSASGIARSNSGTYSIPPNIFAGPLNPTGYTQNQYTGFANEWQNPLPDLHNRSFGQDQTVPQTTITPSSVSEWHQQYYPYQPPMLYSQQFQYMMSGPNTLTQAPSQYAPNMGTLPNYPQSSHLRTYAQPRQAGVPHGTNHRRRHLRTQSLTGSTTSGAGVNASRGGSQSNRRRNRYAGDRSSQTLRSSPSNQTPPVGPAAAANGSSPASNDSYTTLTTAQRAEMARSMHLNPEQLGRVLRRIHQRDERALGMYEEGRVRRRYLDELDEHARYLLGMHARRRYLEELDTYESSPAPKGLDDQSDGRPEPKETEELMLNLECKICMSQAVDTVLLPCGHAILCRWCARQHLEWTVTPRPNPKGYGQCPLCRTPVKQKFRIYFA